MRSEWESSFGVKVGLEDYSKWALADAGIQKIFEYINRYCT